MKKTRGSLAMAVAAGTFFNASLVLAGDGGNVLGGMITGALIGSVFGPNKHVRGQNALIGAVGGAFVGSQIGSSQSSSYSGGDRWDGDSYPSRTTTIIQEVPPPQMVIVTPRREVRTVVVEQYGHETVYVEPQRETITYIQTEPRYYGHHHYTEVEYVGY